jgi:serine/threonine-protein kinase
MEHEEGLKAALGDRYQIEREIGSGGMATVYLAQDLKHDRKVAVKVLRPEVAAPLGMDRFLAEIRITANLSHPHILPLHDSGEADGFLFYVMPYVEGESLRDRLNREKQLRIEDALKIACEVADALGSAHRHNVIHRDIKPENVLLQEGHAVVADFGVARAINAAGGAQLTETGIVVGTPAYMSPEQALGEVQLDGRSDIYSLGCVLYEMLGGEPPYTGPTPQAVIAKKLSEPTPRISVLRELVPQSVESALDKALAKTPADRFDTPAELVDALSPALAVPVGPSHVGHRKAIARMVSRGTGTVPPPIERLAVLPLANLTGDPEQAYFVDGMHRALIAELAQIGALTVISRQSSRGNWGWMQ